MLDIADGSVTRYRIGASRSLSLALFARRATIPISTNECHLYTGPAIGYKTMGASLQVSFFFSFLSFFFFLPLILYHALYCFIFLCFFSSFFFPLFPLPPPPPASPLSLSLISRSIHAYPRLVSTLVRSTHETISECARRYKMGYCPRK